MSHFDTEVNLAFLDHVAVADEWQRRVQVVGDDAWTVNNSGFDEYASSANVFGHAESLKGIVQAIPKSGEVVGLDLAAGSQATALVDLLDSGVLTKALATNYEDRRNTNLKADQRLAHIEGDLTGTDAWRKIIAWQRAEAPDGFSLIMHRPVGPMQNLEPAFYGGAVHVMLDMLRKGGVMFTQIPRMFAHAGPELAGICASVRSRNDVVEVINSKASEKEYLIPDSFAVVLK